MEQLPLLVLIKILFCFIILRRVNFIEVGEVDHTQTNSVDWFYPILFPQCSYFSLVILGLQSLLRPLPFFLWLLLSLFFILTIGAFVYSVVRQLRKKGINKKHVVIFGAGGLGKR